MTGGGLLALSYSRSAEGEADRRSLDLMRKSGMDPRPRSRAFSIRSRRSSVTTPKPECFSTHPVRVTGKKPSRNKPETPTEIGRQRPAAQT
ncbi:M48 family metalloprotease [Rhizobium sullae]|uniref:M48 family metalloprotease n=1 Tax=Rhizobium sullae TaxID=50338 RepID=UPI003CC80968